MRGNDFRRCAALLCSWAIISVSLQAEAQGIMIDENELFADTAITMVDSATLSAAASVGGIDSTVASFSGGMTAVGQADFTRKWFETGDRGEIGPAAGVMADLMLDVRLPFGMKAFTDAEVYFAPRGGGAVNSSFSAGIAGGSDANGLTITVPELFLDANIGRRAYFRFGKQVLQWGRGYFWNPTDLVNIEKKTFIDKIGSREGTFGLKAHVPFGTRWNIYGFLDMNSIGSVDSLAASGRVEALFGGTEAGIALWGKRGRDPVAGFDFSTTLLSWSFTGEISLTSGRNYRAIDLEKSAMFSNDTSETAFVLRDFGDGPVVRLSAGFMRSFDLLDVDDRVLVVGEFYFNQTGDNGNVFRKYRIGDLYGQLKDLPSGMDGDTLLPGMFSALQQGFEFNSIARYYGAFFVTVNKFILSTMSLDLNGLVNFNHRCAMLTAGLNHATLHNFRVGCSVTGVVGPKESEYAFMNTGASVRVTAGVLW